MNETQMLKGLLEGCVLKIISKGECYSAELVEELKKNGFESISEGTLFPLLLRLEARGLFNTRKKANPLGPSRKYYSLNENGERELEIFMEQWKSLKKKINFIFGDADE